MKNYNPISYFHRNVIVLWLLFFSVSLMAHENGYGRWELINNGKLVVSSTEDTNGNKDMSFPSIVKIPSWVTNKANPSANYYLYFAEHHGDYIRMKWAENIEGPWHEYNNNSIGGNGRNIRGVMDFNADDYRDEAPATDDAGFYNNNNSWREDWLSKGHVAAPDVHVDEENQIFIMAWHGKTGYEGRPVDDNGNTIVFRHAGHVGFSKDGLNFNDPVTGGGQSGTWGSKNIPFGPLENHTTKNGVPMEITQLMYDGYARLFYIKGQFWALCNDGRLWKPRNSQSPWTEPLELVDDNKRFNNWWEVQYENEDDLWRSNDPNIVEVRDKEKYKSHIVTWFISSQFENHPNNPFAGYALIPGSGAPKVNHPFVHVLSDNRIEVFIYIRLDTDKYYPINDPWRDVMRIELDCSSSNWDDWHVAKHKETGQSIFDIVITPEEFKAAVEQANGGDVDGTVFADPVSMGNAAYFEENGEKYLFCGFSSYDVNRDFEHAEGQIAPIRIYSETSSSSSTVISTPDFSILPNFGRSELNLQVAHTATIAVINMQGLTVLKAEVMDNASLDVSGISSGIYLIRAEFEGRIICKKWIKQ